jgi:outer membrane protein TolC
MAAASPAPAVDEKTASGERSVKLETPDELLAAPLSPAPATDEGRVITGEESVKLPDAASVLASSAGTATGLVPGEEADPDASPEKAAEAGIRTVLARMKAASKAVGDEGGRMLTLKDAIRTAMMNNLAIRIQEEEVEYAKGNVTYATSEFMPQINGKYDYVYNSSVLYSNALPGHRVDTRVYTGFKNDNAIGITATETVYNGGANVANLKEAKISLKIARETLRAAKLDIEFETKRLFYGLLLAYETRRIAQDLVDQAVAHYEEVRSMYSQGTASRYDLLVSRVKISTTLPQLISADNATQLIKAELKKLLVIDLLDPILFDGRLKHREVLIEEQKFLTDAYADNPQMRIKILGVDLNKWAIEFAKAGWLPQVSANFSGMYRTDNLINMVNPQHGIYALGVSATMPIFDGFATMGKVEEARAKYNQARYRKQDFADQLAVDVLSACLDIRKAKSLIDAETDSVVKAREALRLSEVRYRNGVGINLEVFDSEVSLAQVEQSLAQAEYDYIMGKAQLDRLMGREYQAGD